MKIEIVDGLINGAIFGAWAWIFATKLIADDAPLFWWPDFVDWITCRFPARIGAIFTNALYGCDKCVAGQFGLWSSIAIGLPFWGVLVAIPASIITSSLISRYA